MTDHEAAFVLSDAEYEAALENLAEYERRVAESNRLAQENSLKTAAILDELYRDGRWVEERNAERAATAKTPRGGRPVDPSSRSQFSTWVRNRDRTDFEVPPLDPRYTYQLLDAHTITTSFLSAAHKTPTAEWQVRPLKNLTKVAHGSGKRIPEVWDIAVKLADGDQPTAVHVRDAISEWNRTHLSQDQQRRECTEDKAHRDRLKAQTAVEKLFADGDNAEAQAFHDWYVKFAKERSS